MILKNSRKKIRDNKGSYIPGQLYICGIKSKGDCPMGVAMILETLEYGLSQLVAVAILIFEYIGVMIIVVSGIRGCYNYVTHSPETKLILAKGLAMGLEFKMGSEILRTVVVREWAEIATVAGIIVLRAALTFLIHWEIKQEESGT